MKHCWRLTMAVICVAFLFGVSWAGGLPEDAKPHTLGKKHGTVFSGPADRIFSAENWVLNIYITQKGSRSQGSHGRLFHNGKPVTGSPGEILEIPIGKVRFEKSFHSRAYLWDKTGWQMVAAKVKPKENDARPLSGRPAVDFKKLDKAVDDFSSQEQE